MSNGGAYNPSQWQSFTALNNTSSSYYQQQLGPSQQAYAPPPIWHNFPCGHQMKLEPHQPAPGRCPTCPPPEFDNHTYPKCGHAHSYQKGTQIPSECPVCLRNAWQVSQAAEKAIVEREATEAKRLEDDKDLRVWLNREVDAVCVVGAL